MKKQALATKCSATLNDMAKAWRMYETQYKICVPGRLEKLNSGAGEYGLGDGHDQYRPRWYELLGAQVGQYANDKPSAVEDDSWVIRSEWFLCAAVPEWNNSRNYPFGYNHQFLGNARPKGGWTAGSREWVNYPVPTSRIRAASETVMIADSLGTAVSVGTSKRQGYYADGTKDQDAVANKGYLLDPPRLTANSDRADVELPANYRSGPDARHMGKVNVAFVDGHVQLMTIQEMGYVVNADGSIPPDGTGANNRLFSGNGQDVDPPAAK